MLRFFDLGYASVGFPGENFDLEKNLPRVADNPLKLHKIANVLALVALRFSVGCGGGEKVEFLETENWDLESANFKDR